MVGLTLENCQVSDIVVESLEYPANFSGRINWQFALLDLADSHYAAICMENNDTTCEGVYLFPFFCCFKTHA